MLGKVCRKLQIPLPGRGYWVRREFGKPVQRLPLPEARDLPVVQRLKRSTPKTTAAAEERPALPEPTDPEYVRIKEMESRTILVDPEAKQHKLVAATRQRANACRGRFHR